MYRCQNVNFTCHRKFLYNFIYLFLTVLSLHCCLAFSLAAPSGSCSLVVKCRLLTAAASPAVERGFQGRPASAAVAMGLVTPRHVGSSQIRDPARVSCLGRRLLTQCATKYYSSVCFILGGMIINFSIIYSFLLIYLLIKKICIWFYLYSTTVKKAYTFYRYEIRQDFFFLSVHV